jgi:hypothetical protein
LALLADPAVRRLAKIIKQGEDAQALAAIKVVLERNELYAYGVEPKASFNPAQHVNVNTQVNVVPELRVEDMSDQDLDRYLKLLDELRELLPKDEPKRIGGVSR